MTIQTNRPDAHTYHGGGIGLESAINAPSDFHATPFTRSQSTMYLERSRSPLMKRIRKLHKRARRGGRS